MKTSKDLGKANAVRQGVTTPKGEMCLINFDCPEDYIYYYIKCRDIVGRSKDSVFNSEVFTVDEGWKYDCNNEISDRIMGYEPGEDPGWGIGNSDIMAEICTISRDEALRHIKRQLSHSSQ